MRAASGPPVDLLGVPGTAECGDRLRDRHARGVGDDPGSRKVVMEIVAHGLWAAAAAVTAKRATTGRVSVAWTVWWAAFPDVLAFGPCVAGAAWLWLAGRLGASGGREPPPVHRGLSGDPAG